MEKKGLIKREPIIQESGKISLSVRLTDKGKEQAREVANVFNQVESLSFKGFSQEEKETFLNLLERVYQNIKYYQINLTS